jgi:hypothetical protein
VICGLANGLVSVFMLGPPPLHHAIRVHHLPTPQFSDSGAYSTSLDTLLGHVIALAVCPDQSALVASLYSSGYLCVWDILESSVLTFTQLETCKAAALPPSKLAWADMNTLVVGDEAGCCTLIAVDTGKQSKPAQVQNSAITAVCAAVATSGPTSGPAVFLTCAVDGTTLLHALPGKSAAGKITGPWHVSQHDCEQHGGKKRWKLHTRHWSDIGEVLSQRPTVKVSIFQQRPEKAHVAALGPFAQNNSAAVWTAASNTDGLVFLRLYEKDKTE